jgi:transposase
MQLTTVQRVFVVKEYLQCGSYVAVQNAFQQRFPDTLSPAKTTIWRNVNKYKNEGTSLNLNKGRSGRKRTERSEENVEIVQQQLLENPGISCRRNGVDIDKSTFNRIVKLDLKWYAYKMHVRHELLDTDLPRRRNFAHWFLQRNVRFVENIVIGDEAAFHLNGKVNNQNVRQYAPRNMPPEFNFNVSLCREKVSLWMGMCGNGAIIGPIFYEHNLNGNGYLNMLEERIIPELRQIHGNRMNRLWWIQDGAPCHRSNVVKQLLTDVFNNRIIALNHVIEWPPRSPDLTPCDFFLWGHLKSKVYSTPPANLEDLRERITYEVNLLKENPELVKKVMRAMRKKIELCAARNGGHVEGVGA